VNRKQELFNEQKPTNETPSVTKRVESGTFTRTIIRRDGRKTVKTTLIKPNKKKVIIGHLGDMEVYVYPFEFPNRVFIGKFPYSTSLDRQDAAKMFGLAHTMMWFLNEEPYKKVKRRKAPRMLSERIVSAYNYAQNELIGKK
jgi:hypothetical protein